MTDANEQEFGNAASKVRFQDEVGKIKNRQGEACIEITDDQNVGIGTATPRRKLDILDASNPALRLTHTDNTHYTEVQASAAGNKVSTGSHATNFYELVRAHTNAFSVYQAGSGQEADGSGKGLLVGTQSNGKAYIWAYGNGSNGTLNIGAGGTGGLTMDADNNIVALEGSFQLKAEIAAPSAPAADEGGIFYVKDDGIPYFISDTTAETSLVGGGGGGLTVTAVATGDSPVTGAVDTVYIVNSSGGNVEIDLPAVSGNSGKTIDVLHKTTGNDCIIDPNSSETINGSSTSITLAGVAYQNVTLICDGTEWCIR